AAMLGAAKCYFSMNDFASAADWFIQYAIAAKKNTDNTADLREAYTMLAEANIKLGKFDEACRSYRSAMTLTSNTDETFDVAIKLINLCRNQCRFVEAFDTIEEIDTSLLSDVQVARIWLIKTQILSAMNLNEQAVSFLNSRINTVRDSRLRTEMSLQLGRSHIALNDLQTARDTLCQAILHSEPGFLTTQLQYELAIVCVKLGDNAQAVKICSQILASSIPDELRTQTRTLLATAYTNQKQYDKAAKIFSGAIDAAGARQL
ncbi:MAG: hypothetical protein Q7T18_10835, partial [Sedimentisphaerales bacterium]|nr:hypothetical protein [Sedimentisphaerales bacterium]